MIYGSKPKKLQEPYPNSFTRFLKYVLTLNRLTDSAWLLDEGTF